MAKKIALRLKIKNLTLPASVLLLMFFFLPVKTIIYPGEISLVKDMGLSTNGRPLPLPFAILLDSVSVIYKPNYIYIVNTETKKALPEHMPAKMNIIDKHGKLLEWNIRVDDIILSSSPEGTQDSSYYSPFPFTGGAPSCLLTAVSESTGDTVSGWVCGGSPLFRPKSLHLSGDTSLVFPIRLVEKIHSVIRIAEGDTITQKKYSLDSGKIMFLKGCYIKQAIPVSYTEADTGTSDFKILETPFGIIKAWL